MLAQFFRSATDKVSKSNNFVYNAWHTIVGIHNHSSEIKGLRLN